MEIKALHDFLAALSMSTAARRAPMEISRIALRASIRPREIACREQE